VVLLETMFALAGVGVVLAFAAPPLYAAWKKYVALFTKEDR
jgi:hypothetical protein